MYLGRDNILVDEYLKWELLCRIVLLNYNEERQPCKIVVVRYWMCAGWSWCFTHPCWGSPVV